MNAPPEPWPPRAGAAGSAGAVEGRHQAMHRVVLPVAGEDADEPAGPVHDRELVDLEPVHGRERVPESIVRPAYEDAAPHQARHRHCAEPVAVALASERGGALEEADHALVVDYRDDVEPGVPHAGEGRLGAVAPGDRHGAGTHAVADTHGS